MSLLTIVGIFVVIIVLGILNVISAIRTNESNIGYFDDFIKNSYVLMNSKNNDENYSKHVVYILQNYSELSNIVDESSYNMPIYNIGRVIANGNTLSPLLYNNMVSEFIEYRGLMSRENKKLKSQILNPFILLYRGVESVMNYMFGYIITKFNKDFQPDKSTIWKVLNTIITIVGSIITIFSYINQ